MACLRLPKREFHNANPEPRVRYRFLLDDEAQGLADAIGCVIPGEVAARLAPFAKAAFREYADMMLGEASITTAT